jgi:vacuole morphology and inheritance protein 14
MVNVSILLCLAAMTLTSAADDEIQESIALLWLAEFLSFAHEVMIPFTPRLLNAILPNLAHHHDPIRNAAFRANKLLSSVIQGLPAPSTTDKSGSASVRTTATSPAPSVPGSTTRQTFGKEAISLPREQSTESLSDAGPTPTQSTITPKTRVSTSSAVPTPQPDGMGLPTQDVRSQSPISTISGSAPPSGLTQIMPPPMEEPDPFDYQATVNALTLQFLSEHEETRVAALKWLIMLHQKAPKKV